EQARGDARAVTTAVDIYGLGAVLYETLTGAAPFGGGTTMETIRQVLEEEVRRPSLWNPAVDRDLETVCLKCLEKEPGRRYSSAAGVAADLDRWLRHEPIMARPTGTAERIGKWARRRPAIAALTVLSLGLLLALAIGSSVAVVRVNAAREALRRNLYGSRMALAFQELDDGNVAHVRDLVAATRREQPDLRGFEWRFLWGQSQTQELFTVAGAGGYGCGISPDGRYLAGSGDIRLFDLATRQEVIGSHVDPSNAGSTTDEVAFSPDSRWMACTHLPHQVHLWNLTTKQRIDPSLQVADHAHGVCFSPDGRWLATASGWRYGEGVPGEVQIWDCQTWQSHVTLPGVRDWLTRVKFSPDGRWVAASGGGGFVMVWETTHWQEVARLPGLLGIVFGLCFSPTGEVLAAADSRGMIRIWNVGSWDERLTFAAHRKLIHRIAFSPDGKVLASGGVDETIKLWDWEKPTLLNTLRGHSARVTSLAFHPQGSLLASSSLDLSVKFWNPLEKSKLRSFSGHKAFWNVRVAFSPDGRWLGTTTNLPGTQPVVPCTAVLDTTDFRAVARWYSPSLSICARRRRFGDQDSRLGGDDLSDRVRRRPPTRSAAQPSPAVGHMGVLSERKAARGTLGQQPNPHLVCGGFHGSARD
ncbi:MAG: WD40 repeat domain-containing serine/threonine-protein kinase, partial [Verrucomicrobiota bacterium]